jgi:hypothetical protein
MPNPTPEDMTLLFQLAAIRRLEHPSAALDDARGWSEHIGIVTDGPPETISAYVADNDITADFTSGYCGLADARAVARQRFPTDRHVFVGVSEEAKRLTQSLGWEYLDVADAAADAGWQLTDR